MKQLKAFGAFWYDFIDRRRLARRRPRRGRPRADRDPDPRRQGQRLVAAAGRSSSPPWPGPCTGPPPPGSKEPEDQEARKPSYPSNGPLAPPRSPLSPRVLRLRRRRPRLYAPRKRTGSSVSIAAARPVRARPGSRPRPGGRRPSRPGRRRRSARRRRRRRPGRRAGCRSATRRLVQRPPLGLGVVVRAEAPGQHPQPVGERPQPGAERVRGSALEPADAAGRRPGQHDPRVPGLAHDLVDAVHPPDRDHVGHAPPPTKMMSCDISKSSGSDDVRHREQRQVADLDRGARQPVVEPQVRVRVVADGLVQHAQPGPAALPLSSIAYCT